MEKIVRCVAEGRGNEWEAICLDLDIAVQGGSFSEVYESLNKAIALYLETLNDLPEEDRARLMNRRVPLLVRFRFFWAQLALVFWSGKRASQPRDLLRHSYTEAMAMS